MKIGMIADCHVANFKRFGGEVNDGINRRAQLVLGAIREASIAAGAAYCDNLYVLGDLFDNVRPTPQLVRATAKALLEGGTPVTVLLGNHDMQTSGEQDHACASLSLVEGIEVISRPAARVSNNPMIRIVCLPYSPGLASEWLPAQLSSMNLEPLRGVRTVVFTHVGIWDDDTQPFMKAARDAVGLGQVRWLMDAHGVDLFAAGNWHRRQTWVGHNTTSLVHIPGTLAPNGFHDYGQETGRLSVWDSVTNQVVGKRVSAPRWVTTTGLVELDSVARATDKRLDYMGSHVFVRALVAKDGVSAAGEIAARRSDVDMTIVVEVQPDGPALSTAAQVARRASASDDYTRLIEVEAPGTRDGVARRLADYQKAAQ